MSAILPTSSQAEPFSGPDLAIVAGGATTVGPRRENNEDACYVSPDLDLFIVADGFGGHEKGELASRFAVDILGNELGAISSEPRTDAEIERLVQQAIRDAHCLVASLGEDSLYKGAATTVVLALLFRNRLFVLGVGDSRAYLVRNQRIEQLTRDDSFPQLLADAGVIRQDEVKTHPYRNRLMSALGLDNFDPNKRIRVVELLSGDRLLLASDGLTDVVEDGELLKVLAAASNPQDAADELVRRAIEHDTGDDITCLVFHVSDCYGPDFESKQKWRPSMIWQRWLRGTSEAND